MHTTRQSDLFEGQADTAAHGAETELKSLVTRLFLADEPVPALLQVTAWVPAEARPAWRLVAHTLLARRLACGRRRHDTADGGTDTGAESGSSSEPVRRTPGLQERLAVMAQSWEQPVLAERWEQLLHRLPQGQRLRLVQQASRLRLAH